METNKPQGQRKLTPQELIAQLKLLCKPEIPESKPALKVGELRTLLARLNYGVLLDEELEEIIVTALENMTKTSNSGLATPQIWGYVRSLENGKAITLDKIEDIIDSLLEKDLIHKTGGVMTLYYPGGRLNPGDLENTASQEKQTTG